MTATRQALCCVCGQVRQFRRVLRNHREENYWLSRPVDRDWHRETGDMKCAECGRVTTHALLHPEGDWAVDHAEVLQRVALGCSDPRTDGEMFAKAREQMRNQYRQSNFPSNPYVTHKWWKADENKARDAGEKWFPAMCGEPVAVPDKPGEGRTITEMEAPTQIADPDRTDHDNLDVDSGLWWSEAGACVNCLRVRHEWLLDKRRDELNSLLISLVAKISKGVKVDASVVDALTEQVAAALGGGV